MDWTSVEDGFPAEDQECILLCMKPDGALVQAVGYRINGKWELELEGADTAAWQVRRWAPFAPTRKLG
jgi:hypothetical protein